MSTPQLGRPVGASGEETRQRIIAAAMHCVAEIGCARTTIRQIARTANVTSANLYNYFPNKSAIITATIAARADIALPRLRQAAERPGTAIDRIEAVLDESGRLMREYPDLAAFEWAIRAQPGITVYPGEADDGVPRVGLQALREVIEGIVDDADRRGACRTKPERRAAVEAIYALVYGLAELAATESPDAYHAALGAAKQLVRGSLFEQDR